MKKQALQRGALGFPLGIAIGYIITIVISLGLGQGHYQSVKPELVAAMGSEMSAVLLQTILCGILGASFTGASVVWEVENWSIVKQTGAYLLITVSTALPIAYFTYWMSHSLVGFLAYFGTFIGIFFIAWIIQYLIWKNRLGKINTKI